MFLVPQRTPSYFSFCPVAPANQKGVVPSFSSLSVQELLQMAQFFIQSLPPCPSVGCKPSASPSVVPDMFLFQVDFANGDINYCQLMAKSKVMNGVGTCLAQTVVFLLDFREDLTQLVDPSFNFLDFFHTRPQIGTGEQPCYFTFPSQLNGCSTVSAPTCKMFKTGHSYSDCMTQNAALLQRLVLNNILHSVSPPWPAPLLHNSFSHEVVTETKVCMTAV